MDSYIAKIYELMYSPIVTPYNLLENAKLDNYQYVNYYKGKSGLIVEMKCSMDEGKEVVFYYHFDKDDSLMEIHEEVDGEIKIIFNRYNELSNVKKTYINRVKDSIESHAI